MISLMFNINIVVINQTIIQRIANNDNNLQYICLDVLANMHWIRSLYILHHELGQPHTLVDAAHHFEMLFLVKEANF